jgi:Glycosyl transferase family 2
MRDDGPRLAMVMCVRDEAEFISDHLLFHHHLGVARGYVFLDGCTDNTFELLTHFPWVVAIERSHGSDCAAGLTAYQEACALEALTMARSEGFDWLMHIDADEYVWADNPGNTLQEQGDLRALICRASPQTELIHLRPKEVIAIRGTGRSPVWSQCYFQDMPHVFERDLMDPTTGRVRCLQKWAGHNIGKSIVRTIGDVEPFCAHGWVGRGRGGLGRTESLETEYLGFHYHYVFAGARNWLRKYRKLAWEPGTWTTGDSVPFPKQAWKEASLSFADDEAEEYYERWVAVEEDLVKERVAKGQVVYETMVRDTMIKLKTGASSMPVAAPSTTCSPPVATCAPLSRG